MLQCCVVTHLLELVYKLVQTPLQAVNVHLYMLHCNNKSDISVYVQSKVICMLLMCQKSLSIPLADYGRINLQCFLTSRYFVHSVSHNYIPAGSILLVLTHALDL